MTLPGFTAENSLSNIGRGYRMRETATVAGAEIIPQQFCYWQHNSLICCDWEYENGAWIWHCSPSRPAQQ
jgi:hypothetical protein